MTIWPDHYGGNKDNKDCEQAALTLKESLQKKMTHLGVLNFSSIHDKKVTEFLKWHFKKSFLFLVTTGMIFLRIGLKI